MITGVLRTQTQLTRFPPCKGWNSTLESQEQRHQLPTIKKLSRKLLLLLSLCPLLPVSKSLSLQLSSWFSSIRRYKHPFHFHAKFTFCQRPFLLNEFYSEGFGTSRASSHTFCCRGSIHSKQFQGCHHIWLPRKWAQRTEAGGAEAAQASSQGSHQHLAFPKGKALISIQCFISKL